MKVSLLRGGGLAGLVTGTALKSESLPPEEAETLRRKVDEAGVLELPEDASGGSGHPDETSYGLTVEHEGREHTIHLRESELPEQVRGLISWIDSHPEKEEWVDSPGRGT